MLFVASLSRCVPVCVIRTPQNRLQNCEFLLQLAILFLEVRWQRS